MNLFSNLPTARVHRIAASVFFFIAGLSFASWASRIPDIKEHLHLKDAALGSVLLSLPLGLMTGLPLAGWATARLGSKKVATISAILYSYVLILLGLAQNIWQLSAALYIFGLLGNLLNISINTQAVGVEKLYGRSIMSGLHGVWSVAGFLGAGIGWVMVSFKIAPYIHFIVICVVVQLLALVIYNYLLPKDAGGPASQQRLFIRPDKSIFILGLIAFACMGCEGAMFDWSGVYFKNIVKAPDHQVVVGYAAFMGAMATGRFVSDSLITRLGVKFMLKLSGIVIFVGLLIAIVFPYFISATFGFLLVGFGVSSVVPTIYGLAGKSKIMQPSIAIAAVSSVSFFGFLLGPPIIGFISAASSLQWSFALIAVLGLCVSIATTKINVQ